MTLNLGKIYIPASVLFLVDQSLFPMFHIGSIPIKPSYAILIGMLLVLFFEKKSPRSFSKKTFIQIALPVLAIASLGALGQLYLSTQGSIQDPFVAVRSIIVYLFMILAFNLGQRSHKLPMMWVVVCFYGFALTILILTMFPDNFSWLAQLWWNSTDVIQEKLALNESRPNPFGDGSLVMVEILFLFIVTSVRHKFIELNLFISLSCITLAIGLALILSSRNQMIAMAILTVALISGNKKGRLKKNLEIIIIISVMIILFIYVKDTIRHSVSSIDYALHRFENLTSGLSNVSSSNFDDTVLRPLARFDRFFDRFIESPIFGSGFSILNSQPFQRLNFHNDWFHIIATTGLIGGGFFFFWIYRIFKLTEALVLLPFFLPGLTNSFILHISGILVYCLLLGVIIERIKRTPNYTPQKI